MPQIQAQRWTLLLSLCVSLVMASTAWSQDEEMMEKKEMASPTKSEAWQNNLQPYVEYSLGLSIVRNQNLTGSDPPNPDFGGRIETKEGINVGGALGIRLLDQFRTEIAFGYQTNEVTNQNVRPGETRADGDVSLFTAMVNGYYEYHLSQYNIPLLPYVGAGVGFGLARLDAETRSALVQIDDEDAVFTWNVMAGVTYPLNKTTEFSLGYRYIATDDIQHKGRIAGTGVRFIASEYDSHDVRVGMRFNF